MMGKVKKVVEKCPYCGAENEFKVQTNGVQRCEHCHELITYTCEVDYYYDQSGEITVYFHGDDSRVGSNDARECIEALMGDVGMSYYWLGNLFISLRRWVEDDDLQLLKDCRDYLDRLIEVESKD